MSIRNMGLIISGWSPPTPEWNISGNASIGNPLVASGTFDSFVPSSIAGLVLWYDMLDSSAYTQSAGTITSVTNKATGVVHNTGTLPTYSATGFNGALPSMNFATNRYIDNTEAGIISALAHQAPVTIFFAVDNTVDGNSAWLSCCNAADLQGRKFGLSSSNLGRLVHTYVGGATDNITDTTGDYDHNNPHIVEWWGSTNLSCNLDGTLRINNSLSNQPFTASTRATVGRRSSLTPDHFATMSLGSLLVYNSVLTSGQRASVRAYLGSKWGVTVI